jgi:hypothetical protein
MPRRSRPEIDAVHADGEARDDPAARIRAIMSAVIFA